MMNNQTSTDKTGGPRLPVAMIKVPDFTRLNQRLRDYLLNLSQSVPDSVSNNQSGVSYFANKWLSKAQLHKSNNNDLQTLKTFAELTANRMFSAPEPDLIISTISMWSIISEAGLTGSRHNHRGRVSGAYYVDAGSSGKTDGGLMQFYHQPGSSHPTHSVTPEPGMLLLFPSSLEHSVTAYTGKNRRIVISLNMS